MRLGICTIGVIPGPLAGLAGLRGAVEEGMLPYDPYYGEATTWSGSLPGPLSSLAGRRLPQPKA